MFVCCVPCRACILAGYDKGGIGGPVRVLFSSYRVSLLPTYRSSQDVGQLLTVRIYGLSWSDGNRFIGEVAPDLGNGGGDKAPFSLDEDAIALAADDGKLYAARLKDVRCRKPSQRRTFRLCDFVCLYNSLHHVKGDLITPWAYLLLDLVLICPLQTRIPLW